MTAQLIQHEKKLQETILNQYIECTRLLEEFFSIEPDTCWKKNNIGCCGVNKNIADYGITGHASERLFNLREERRLQTVPENPEPDSRCPYHTTESGCVLEELKSPWCAAYTCAKPSVKYDTPYVYFTLSSILEAQFPEDNQQLIKEFKNYMQGLIVEAKASKK